MNFLDINNEQELNEWVKHFVGYVLENKMDQAQSMMEVIREEDRPELYNKVRDEVKKTHPEIELPDLVPVEPTVSDETVALEANNAEVEISDEVAKSDSGEQSDETVQQEAEE